jgi:flagellar biogenesis protein FliO
MSLIRVRRRRKKEWIDVKRGKSPGKLVLLLAFVLLLLWYLGRI